MALEDRTAELRRKVATAKFALARWIDEDANRPLGERPPIDSVPLHAHTLASELETHPEIVSMTRQEQMAQTEARLAQANKKPDWSVELMYQQRGSAYSNMVSIGVSVPLPWDQPHRQDRELASKLAMAEQMKARRDDMLRAHVAEVRAMLAEWESDHERQARYRDRLVPLARERTEAALAAYRGGKSSLADVLSARRSEVEVRMQTLLLEMETARAWAQLAFLIPASAEPSSVTHSTGVSK